MSSRMPALTLRATSIGHRPSDFGYRTPLLLLPRHEAFVELGVLAVERDVAPRDDDVLHLRADLERVTLHHDQVGQLAGLDAPDLAVDAENARGVEGHRANR